jgi:hypothetical protein
MAYVQFDRLMGSTHVFGRFENKEQVIGFGKVALDEILEQIVPGNQFEIRALYSEFRKIRLVGAKMSFDIDEDCDRYGVYNLEASIQGHGPDLGCYFVFAEGGGAYGLIRYVRQLAKWAA